jgi:hypothetical protein
VVVFHNAGCKSLLEGYKSWTALFVKGVDSGQCGCPSFAGKTWYLVRLLAVVRLVDLKIEEECKERGGCKIWQLVHVPTLGALYWRCLIV